MARRSNESLDSLAARLGIRLAGVQPPPAEPNPRRSSVPRKRMEPRKRERVVCDHEGPCDLRPYTGWNKRRYLRCHTRHLEQKKARYVPKPRVYVRKPHHHEGECDWRRYNFKDGARTLCRRELNWYKNDRYRRKKLAQSGEGREAG